MGQDGAPLPVGSRVDHLESSVEAPRCDLVVHGVDAFVAAARRRTATASGISEKHAEREGMPSRTPVEFQYPPRRRRLPGKDHIAVPIRAGE
jgi:hypothetical protein